jgi:DNA-directed RNA polymerase subunit alpha
MFNLLLSFILVNSSIFFFLSMHIIQELIGKPKVTEKKVSGSISLFTVSPLPPGFGMTLGNSLRRTLLSSIPGAGITAVRVTGAPHEYMSLPGVRDSVLDIILALKNVFFKKFSKDAEVIKIEKKGESEVFARDIICSPDVEILTPDVLITSLEKGASLSIEIRLEKGVGYSSVKDRMKTQDHSGWILVDTIYSPVRKVRYEVLPTRVGEMTSLDKLEIEIETTGAISSGDSLKFSSQLLQNYFRLIEGDAEEEIEVDFLADFSRTQLVSSGSTEESDEEKESYTPIEILNLSPRTLNALINGNIGSVEEVLRSNPIQLESLRGFGKKAMTELHAALKKHGYSWSGGEEE